MNESNLLILGVCPYNYECKHTDCLECAKIHHGEIKEE